MHKKLLTSSVLLIALVVGILASLPAHNETRPIALQSKATTSSSQSVDTYVGTIATTTSGDYLYTNTKYGFQFTYPGGWRPGDNFLGFEYGTFQLFNYPYDSPDASSRGFANGENKIEADVIDGSPASTMSSYDTSQYETTSTELVPLNLAGENSIRVDGEAFGGQKFRGYILALTHVPNESLGITIYGDPSNFNVLDELVQTIAWK